MRPGRRVTGEPSAYAPRAFPCATCGYTVSMRSFRTLLTATAAAVAAVPAATAQAANPYTAAGVCGPGYGVIQRHNVTGPKGGVLGTAVLAWNGSTQKNCAVMLKRRAVGVATWTEVSLAKKGGGYRAQDGFFSYYAGPLYVKAPGTCVIFGGRMRDARGNGGGWITPFPVHCK